MAQNHLRAALDSINAIIYVADLTSHEILFINRYTEDLFGNIVGKICWRALQSGQTGPCPNCTNEKLLDAEGRPRGSIEREKRNSINGRWYEIRDSVIDWPDGRLVRLQISIDITERKQLEEEIRKSEEKFRTFADFTYNWEYWTGPDGDYVYISPSCERLTGYHAEEFMADPDLLTSIIHADDRVYFRNHLGGSLGTFSEFHYDFRILTKNGEERWIAHSSQPVYDAKGRNLGRRASNRDITHLKKVEEMLSLREKHFRLALDATSDGVWDRNLHTGEVYYGDNWAKILGFTAEEVKRRELRWEDFLHPDDRERALSAVKRHLEGETSKYVAEFRMRHKSGNWLWVLARGKVVEWDDEERPLRFVGTHCDISNLKQAEEELRRSSEKIKQFAYSVVHDLKNPAISIHGLTRHLHGKYGEKLDDRGGAICEQILRSSEHIASLVDKINIFIAARETPLVLEDLSLREILDIIREEFSVKLDLAGVKWLQPDELPDIRADRIALLRVFRNLVDNALKYGGDQLSEIEINCQTNGDMTILSVRDDGVGLKQEETKGLFAMFKRKKSSRGVDGAGIGLAIVKEIAEQHGGRVWVEHGGRKGVAFNFSIPRTAGTRNFSPLPLEDESDLRQLASH